MRVTGLDHIVVRCRDVEASLAWYCGELGLEALAVDAWRAGERPFPSVRIDPATIIDLIPAGDSPGASGGPGHLDHIALVVEGAGPDELLVRFPGARRADRLSGARGLGTGVYVTSPDGLTVELRVYG